MMKMILAAALAILPTVARAATTCPGTGTGLNLQICPLGADGTAWATAMRNNFNKISTGAVINSSTTSSDLASLRVGQILGLPTGSGIWISSPTTQTSSATFLAALQATSLTGRVVAGQVDFSTITTAFNNVGSSTKTLTDWINSTGSALTTETARAVAAEAVITGYINSTGSALTSEIGRAVAAEATKSSTGTCSGATFPKTLNSGGLTCSQPSDVTGNAATVTNGVYTNGSYSDPAWLALSTGILSGILPVDKGGTGADWSGRLKGEIPSFTANGVLGAVAPQPSCDGMTNPFLVGDTGIGGPQAIWSCSPNANISGNAATVSNGVYTNYSYPDPSWITTLATSKIDLSTVAAAIALKANLAGANTFSGPGDNTFTYGVVAGTVTALGGFQASAGGYSWGGTGARNCSLGGLGGTELICTAGSAFFSGFDLRTESANGLRITNNTATLYDPTHFVSSATFQDGNFSIAQTTLVVQGGAIGVNVTPATLATYYSALGTGYKNLVFDSDSYFTRQLGGGNITHHIVAGNEADVVIRMDPDRGDDAKDVWRLTAQASDNSLLVKNDGVATNSAVFDNAGGAAFGATTVSCMTVAGILESKNFILATGGLGVKVAPRSDVDFYSVKNGTASSNFNMLDMHTAGGTGLMFGIDASNAPYPMWFQTGVYGNDSTQYPLAFNPRGGNVCIGCMSAETTLDVNGGATVRGQETIIGTVTLLGASLRMGMNADIAAPGYLLISPTGNLYLRSGGSFVTIADAGSADVEVALGGGNIKLLRADTGSVFLGQGGVYASTYTATDGKLALAGGLTTGGVIKSSSPIPSITCDAGTPVLEARSTSQSGGFVAGSGAITLCTLTFSAGSWGSPPVCNFWAGEAGVTLTTPYTTCSASLCYFVGGVGMSGKTFSYSCWGAP